MGLQDLERQVVRFTHPAHVFASIAMAGLPLLAGACMVVSLVLGTISLPLEELGPEPKIVDCHVDDTPCRADLPGWLQTPHADAEVEELAYRRIRHELEAEMAQFRGTPPAEWDPRAQELDVGQPRTTVDWIAAEGELQRVPEDWPTLPRRALRDTPWENWVDMRAWTLAGGEARAYRAAWDGERDRHFDIEYARTKQLHDAWTWLRMRGMMAAIAVALMGIGLVLALVAFGVFGMRLRWAPFTVVLTRHALGGAEDERTMLAGLSDLEIQGVVDRLQRFGHTPTCGTAELTDALLARRDAAEQGALPPASHREALGTMLDRGRAWNAAFVMKCESCVDDVKGCR